MSVTRTALTSGSLGSADFVASGGHDTASITPTANRYIEIYIWQVAFQPDQVSVPVSVTGNGITYTMEESVTDLTVGCAFTLWRGMSASPSAGVVSINLDETSYFLLWAIAEIDSIDTSGTNASGAIVQSVPASSLTGSGTSAPATLAAFGSASNGASFGTGHTAASAGPFTCTPDTGWTEGYDFGTTYAGGVAYAALETQFRADNDTSATGTWSGAGYIASIGVEIKAAAVVALTGALLAPRPNVLVRL